MSGMKDAIACLCYTLVVYIILLIIEKLFILGNLIKLSRGIVA